MAAGSCAASVVLDGTAASAAPAPASSQQVVEVSEGSHAFVAGADGAAAYADVATGSAAASATAAASAIAPAAPAVQPDKVTYDRGGYILPPPDDTIPSPAPGGTAYHAVKRAFDLVFSAVATAVCLVPGAIICAAIVIDSPGASPIFTQKRVGQYGKPLYMYKFRSMYPDAHSNPERYFSPEQMQQWLREQKVDDDPRITRVGRFLRKTSLDELPQFLNVLKGELSVIGPRPVTMEETYDYGTARDLVLSIKPGITGWWQVCARNEATWESGDRQALEVFYARHASLPLDMRIFARTFKAMARGR